MSNSLDPDQARQFVGPGLGPNCLQRLLADAASRQRVLDTTLNFLAKTLAKVNFIWLQLFSIWLKCRLQQTLSQGKPLVC